MLIVILSDVQYSQKAVFRFEKGLNGQNQSSSGPHHLVKKSPPHPPTPPLPLAKFLIPPLWGDFRPLLTAIWKSLKVMQPARPL